MVWFVQGNPGALLPVWALAVMFGLWWWKGRDPDPGLSVAPMYEPPKGLTPAEAGTLLEDAVEARDITSTVIDLAVKGYIKIIEQNDKVLFITHRDYVLQLMKPRPEWQGLAGHELVVLDNIFPLDTMVSGASDTETTLSSLKERFYIALPSIRQQIMEALDSKNLYATDPDSAKGLALVGVLVIVLPFLWLQMTGRISLFNSPTVLAAGVVLSVVIVALFGRRLAAKTVRGARARVECLGFKEFMTRVDGDRIKRMPPDTFEKFLPYAMAFGVEHHWAKAFEGLLTEPPAWYVGSGYGTPGMLWTPLLFASAMNTFSSSAYQSFSAAPQASSSGSGFGSGGGFDGGGGFSGGGGGAGCVLAASGGDAFAREFRGGRCAGLHSTVLIQGFVRLHLIRIAFMHFEGSLWIRTAPDSFGNFTDDAKSDAHSAEPPPTQHSDAAEVGVSPSTTVSPCKPEAATRWQARPSGIGRAAGTAERQMRRGLELVRPPASKGGTPSYTYAVSGAGRSNALQKEQDEVAGADGRCGCQGAPRGRA